MFFSNNGRPGPLRGPGIRSCFHTFPDSPLFVRFPHFQITIALDRRFQSCLATALYCLGTVQSHLGTRHI